METSEERLEVIFEELSSVEMQEDGRVRVDTLKSCVAGLLQHANDIKRRKDDERDDAEWLAKVAHGLVGVAAVAIAMVGAQRGSPGDWLYANEFSLRVWAIAFSAIYVGIAIERTPLASRLWAFGVTKVSFSVAVSALAVVSTAKASGLLNAVFGVDASAMPYARAILAAIVGVTYVYPLVLILAPFALWHAWVTVDTLKKHGSAEFPFYSSLTTLLSVLAMVVLVRWGNVEFSDSALPTKAYILAHELDFRAHNRCANLDGQNFVLFIGDDQANVLVDTNPLDTFGLSAFVQARSRAVDELRKGFVSMKCEMPSAPSKLPSGFPHFD